MPVPDSPAPYDEDLLLRAAPPSREEIIITEALRRRTLATAASCLPAIIREAGYEELRELLHIFWHFGSPEAIRLENAEGQFDTPRLTLEEANALVLFRMMRGECYVPPGCAGPESAPAPGDPPSREEVIVTQAFRRRATARAERCLPTIIREAVYEDLEEMIAIFRWFGNSEAMRLEAPEDYVRVPGLTLEEANALVRYRMERRKYAGAFGGRKPETPPPKSAVAEPAASAGAATPAPAQAPGAAFPAARSAAPPEPPGPAGPAEPATSAPPAPEYLYRVFRHGRMWFLDPKTNKIVGPAPT
jgi:hypothetical protein